MGLVQNDRDIKALFSEGYNIVEPFDEEFLQPASIDLRLGNICYEYELEEYTLGDIIDEENNRITKEFDELPLQSGGVAFVGVYEKMNIPDNMIGIVFPRSSISRLGVHIVTTYMNPGYKGYMPLTIINHRHSEIKLKPRFRVVQLVLLALESEPLKRYKEVSDAKYYDESVESSRLHHDQELSQIMDGILKKDVPSLYNLIKSKK